MKMLKYSEFIKPDSLTEAAFEIANSLWAKIDAYIQNPEIWFSQLLASGKWTSKVSDLVLERLIAEHFTSLLASHGFNLTECSLELFKSNEADENYGILSFEVQNATNTLKQQKEIKVRITITLSRLGELTATDALRTLYHELVHADQECKTLFKLGVDTVITMLTPFIWTSIDDMVKRPIHDNAVSYANSKDETAPYAGDVALSLFHKYKNDLRNKPVEEQDMFIRTVIIPNIQQEFTTSFKTNYLNMLEDPKRKHKFYILLTQQLKEFASRISNNG